MMGLSAESWMPKGHSSPRPVYPQEIRDKALALHRQGVAIKAIARELNIGGDRTVRQWIRGESSLERRPKVDRIGEKAGLLEIKEEVDAEVAVIKGGGNPDPSKRYFLCECSSCGRKKFYSWDTFSQLQRKLAKGDAKSLGCNWCSLGSAIDFSDQLVGAWRVVRWRKVPNTIPSVKSETLVEWLCRCTICEKTEKWQRAGILTAIANGARQNQSAEGVGCGCNTKPNRASYQKYGRELMEWFYDIKKRAKKDGLPFDLEPSDLAKIPEYCPVLGIPLQKSRLERGGAADNAPSVDKFIPELGYVKTNINIISYRANRFKSDGTPDEWKKIAEWCQKEEVRRRLSGEEC
jgi:transposase-like protein